MRKICVILFCLIGICALPSCSSTESGLEKFHIYLELSWGRPTYRFNVISSDEIQIAIDDNWHSIEDAERTQVIKLSEEQCREINRLVNRVARKKPISEERADFYMDASEVTAIINENIYWSLASNVIPNIQDRTSEHTKAFFSDKDVDKDLILLLWRLADFSPIPIGYATE